MNNQINLIGISGKIGSGKDTVGKIIQNIITWQKSPIKKDCVEDVMLSLAETSIDNTNISNWKIKKFAGKLKQIASILTGIPVEKFEDQEFKKTNLGGEWNRFFSKDQPDVPMTVRDLLQKLGTEAMRDNLHPNVWCNALFSEWREEEWKDIKGYEGKYQASTKGNIRSLNRQIDPAPKQYSRTRKGQLLKPTLSGNYLTVSLEGKTFTVHSLVADTFFPGNKENNWVVNHKDFNTLNNNYINLEWVPQYYNIQHNKKYLRGNFGENQKDAKLTSAQVIKIRELISVGELSQNSIAKLFKVSPTTISDIKSGKKWNHVGKEIPQVFPLTDDQNWIITDLRFPNEYQAIKDRGGVCIRVNRTVNDVTNGILHSSEMALDNHTFDYEINNKGSIEDLVEEIRIMLLHFKIIE